MIGYRTFLFYSGMVPEENWDEYTLVKNVVVSEDNPYYSSYEGGLYSKDKKRLLFDAKLYRSNPYTVPDFVESFEPTNGIKNGVSEEKMILGKS